MKRQNKKQYNKGRSGKGGFGNEKLEETLLERVGTLVRYVESWVEEM